MSRKTKQTPRYKNKRGQPFKTLFELDKVLGGSTNNMVLLDMHNELSKGIILLEMAYVVGYYDNWVKLKVKVPTTLGLCSRPIQDR